LVEETGVPGLCRGQAGDVLQKGLKINYCTRQ
jgi:hypothetical protein